MVHNVIFLLIPVMGRRRHGDGQSAGDTNLASVFPAVAAAPQLYP